MRKEEKKINDKGFSLVELIVVIAIMVALVAVVAVAVTRYVAQSRAATDVTNAQTIKSAIQVEITDPSSGTELVPTSGTTTWTVVPTGMASLPNVPTVESRDLKSGSFVYFYRNSDQYVGVGITGSRIDGTATVSTTGSYESGNDLTISTVANNFKKQTTH